MNMIPKFNQLISKVLLVEDDHLAQIAAKIILIDAGLKVSMASSGREAMQLTNHNSYDLILMDIGLPDMDGFEVTALIKSSTGPNHSTPVLALTAHGDHSYEQQSTTSGMHGYVVKPITSETILAILGK